MALVKGKLAKEMKLFVKQANQLPVEDQNKAIDNYCKKLEELIYGAIRSITITLPPGSIIVAGSPATQTNPAPIVIQGNVTIK